MKILSNQVMRRSMVWAIALVFLLSLFTLSAIAAQPNPMRGFALANIAISTPNQERLITWYTDVLGFRLVNKSEGVGGIKLALIEKDGVQMDLIQPPTIQPLSKPQDPPMHLETPGLRNLVFWVDNLKVANVHLKSKQVPLLFESLYVDGIRTTISAFRDPDGNLVALWQKRNR